MLLSSFSKCLKKSAVFPPDASWPLIESDLGLLLREDPDVSLHPFSLNPPEKVAPQNLGQKNCRWLGAFFFAALLPLSYILRLPFEMVIGCG